MKILLLEHPRNIAPHRCNDIANTPLSSSLLTGYAAGMLAGEGHDVEIVEGYLEGLSYAEMESRIAAAKPDLLGVHIIYHWQTDHRLYAFLEQAKQGGLCSYITAYGYYPTFAREEILRDCPALDSVIVGEPEETFAVLAGALSHPAHSGDIPGLARRDEAGNIICSRRKPVQDLDTLPFPVRTGAMLRLPEVNIQGSRGCYGGCTFCYVNPFNGQQSHWRGRSPENIIAEIDHIIGKWGRRDFYFTDPNFFGPGQRGQERALRLASLLKSRNVLFGLEARVNDIHDKTVGPLVEAGLRHLLIGLESGRDQSLQRMNKMTTVAQNERALAILRKHGIEPNIGFIMFEPDSTLADIRVNLEFLRRNDLLKDLFITANVLYHHQIILKGTPVFRNLQREGRLELSSSSAYEGVTAFVHREVAVLADIMRRITNCFFNCIADIWSGEKEQPEHARESYAKLNSLLVKWFETALRALEAGEQFPGEEQDAIVREAEKTILNCLKML
ncbi:MAG: B12-binding domain-containing radical SAM protein [Firmicutes bacterium]|nr:B12-binding domain-containing radical SAM protein [Bacillota bacterium]